MTRLAFYLFFNTVALLLIVILSWRTAEQKKTSDYAQPLMTATAEEAEDEQIPLQYRI